VVARDGRGDDGGGVEGCAGGDGGVAHTAGRWISVGGGGDAKDQVRVWGCWEVRCQ
jgi:hypothetical protein